MISLGKIPIKILHEMKRISKSTHLILFILILICSIISCSNKDETNITLKKDTIIERFSPYQLKEKQEAIYLTDCGLRPDTLSTEYTYDNTLWKKEYKWITAKDNNYSLRNEKRNIEIYRFVQLGTYWDEHYAITRIELKDTNVMANTILFDTRINIKGKHLISQSKILTYSEWKDFKALIDKINFWHLPNEVNHIGCDGGAFYLEGYLRVKYHIIYRWTPPEESNFYKCYQYLEQISGLSDLYKQYFKY